MQLEVDKSKDLQSASWKPRRADVLIQIQRQEKTDALVQRQSGSRHSYLFERRSAFVLVRPPTAG